MKKNISSLENIIAAVFFGVGGVYLGVALGDMFLGTNMASRQNAKMIAEDDFLQDRAKNIEGTFRTLNRRFPDDSKITLRIPQDRAGRAKFSRTVNDIFSKTLGNRGMAQDISGVLGTGNLAMTMTTGDLWGRCVISIPASYSRTALPTGERDDKSTIAVTVAHEMSHCRVAKNRHDGKPIPRTPREEETFADIRSSLMVSSTWSGWENEILRYQKSVRLSQKAQGEEGKTHDTIYGLERLERFLNEDSFAREITGSALGTPFGVAGVKEWMKSADSEDLDKIALLLSVLP